MPQIKGLAITKTIAGDADYLILQNPTTNETYRITKADFLKGIYNTQPSDPTNNILLSVSFEGVNNSSILTSSTGIAFSTQGNARISTARYKTGASSGLFDGASSFYIGASNNGLNFSSTNNFNIEAWIYREASNISHAICGTLPQIGNLGYSFHIGADNKLAFESDGANPNIKSSLLVPSGEWVFVKLIKNLNNYNFLVNSTNENFINSASWGASGNNFYIGQNGRNDGYAGFFQGNIDDLKISTTL